MRSTMQDSPLTISRIVRYATTVHSDAEVVTWTGTAARRADYATLGRRASRLAKRTQSSLVPLRSTKRPNSPAGLSPAETDPIVPPSPGVRRNEPNSPAGLAPAETDPIAPMPRVQRNEANSSAGLAPAEKPNRPHALRSTKRTQFPGRLAAAETDSIVPPSPVRRNEPNSAPRQTQFRRHAPFDKPNSNKIKCLFSRTQSGQRAAASSGRAVSPK